MSWKAKYIGAAAVVFWFLVCIVGQIAYGAQPDPQPRIAPPVKQGCAMIDTDRIRYDIQHQKGRNDPEWYQTLIRILAYQLDCERGHTPKPYHGDD